MATSCGGLVQCIHMAHDPEQRVGLEQAVIYRWLGIPSSGISVARWSAHYTTTSMLGRVADHVQLGHSAKQNERYARCRCPSIKKFFMQKVSLVYPTHPLMTRNGVVLSGLLSTTSTCILVKHYNMPCLYTTKTNSALEQMHPHRLLNACIRASTRKMSLYHGGLIRMPWMKQHRTYQTGQDFRNLLHKTATTAHYIVMSNSSVSGLSAFSKPTLMLSQDGIPCLDCSIRYKLCTQCSPILYREYL